MTGWRRATAAVVASPGAPFLVEEVEIGAPAPDEVLVRIDAVGICHADIQAQTGAAPVPTPVVAGHEGTGTVEEVGASVTTLRPGDRVVLTFDSCGRCDRCQAGTPTQCREFVARNFTAGTRPDGTSRLRFAGGPANGSFFGQSALATYALATERNAIPVTTGLPPELLAPLGCAVQTGAGGVWNVLAPPPGAPVVVFGAGAVGLSAVMAAAIGDREVVAVDTQDSRLELARELGATGTVNPMTDDPEQAIRDLLAGGAPFVFESSGAPAALSAGIRALAPGGTIAVVGVSSFGTTVPLDVADLVNDSKRVVGVVEGASRPHEFLPRLAGLVEDGSLPLHKLVSTFPLSDIGAAIAAVHDGHVVKPVILPGR
ncbi:NAD(P)-dependent alcohol dehydrogenase [Actinacidiphila yeochonensis]|uniref:NAD(P)-dependent alcohol dehydrogenase n=1 Tax=Actinacidiphila yeochonensis TaxID=89050 RepID=UPI000569B453|nr:NAD(P)-dependent alcohol dehydrogenase [Actinacidiphila yeochonensis]